MILDVNKYRYSNLIKKKRRWPYIVLSIILIVLISGSIYFLVFGSNKNNIIFIKRKNKTENLLELWNNHSYGLLINKCNSILKTDKLNRESLVFSGFSYFYESLAETSIEKKNPMLLEAIKRLRLAKLTDLGLLDSEVSYILAKVYFHLGRFYYDLSIKYFEDALAKGFKADDLYEYLGLAYSQIGDPEKGIENYVKSLEIKNSDVVLLSIAKNYIQLNNIDKAKEYLQRTLNLTEDSLIEEKARFMMADLYMKRGELIKAEDEYKKIISIDSKSADAHYYLGEVYRKMNYPVKARAEWREALKIDPNHYAAKLRYYK